MSNKYDVYSINGKRKLGSYENLEEISKEFKISVTSLQYAYAENDIVANKQVIDSGAEAKDISHKKSNLKKSVILYSHEGEFIKEFESTAKASRELGINQSSASALVNKDKLDYKSAYNLRFKGVEPKNLYEGNQVIIYTLNGKPLGITTENGIEAKKFNTFEEAFKSVGLEYDESQYSSRYKKLTDKLQFIREPYEEKLLTVRNQYLIDKGDDVQLMGSYEEIAKYLGVSRERVRQIVSKNIELKKLGVKEPKLLKGYRIVKIN